MNGTAIIASIIYSLVGEQKLVKHLACNSIHNTLLAGFYLRDDKPEEVEKYLPGYRKELQELEENGLTFNGKHYNIEFCGKADYKYMRCVAGIQDGEPCHGCATCLCHKDNYGLTRDEHEALAADAAAAAAAAGEAPPTFPELTGRDADLTSELLHEPKGETYKCRACGDDIGPDHVEDRSVEGGSFETKDKRDEQCQAHFSVSRSWFYKMIPGWRLIMDLLHNKLRIVPQLYYWTVAAPLNGQADRQLEVRIQYLILNFCCSCDIFNLFL